ncbi:MFS general substrate transporter [Neoconidiobolus thromboides FSU 785]|nr:MFS general substrate transporter [Neoconidiobolus thromboides FSU 785]
MDEKKGWAIVCASFVLHFILLGIQYTFGVYLVEYKENVFKDQANTSIISLIGSTSLALLSAGGIISGRLCDRFGYVKMALIGNFIFSISLLLASFSTEVWHLFLTQGIMLGMSSSMAFFPAVSISSQYFKKYLGVATGICVAGSGIGGLVLSPITQKLLEVLGFRWTLRIMALFALIGGSIASLFIKQRIFSKRMGKFIDFTIFKDKRFLLLVAGGFISSLGYLIPFLILPSYAKDCNIGVGESAILLGVLNGGNALGRVFLGIMADKLGKLNIMALGIFFTGLFCLISWLFSSTFVSLIIFCILYGSVAGALIALLPVTSASLFGLNNLATINGLLYVANGIPSLIGTPLATALINLSSNGNNHGPSSYLPVILFSGISGIVGSVFIFWLKYCINPKTFKKV